MRSMVILCTVLYAMLPSGYPLAACAETLDVRQNQVLEIHFQSTCSYAHPSRDVELDVRVESLRLIYFPRGVMPWGQTYRLLQLDVDTTYRATFIDPLTGTEHPIQDTISGVQTWQVPATPILQDWLLTLQPLAQPPVSHPAPVNAQALEEASQLLDHLYAIRTLYDAPRVLTRAEVQWK